ncbi:MAG: protein phosphatase 2C domain-containing protein [Anaerolineae bacterium]|nr:protein phosphatase 2C domain-containing protein [Anaerolineae bacterium]
MLSQITSSPRINEDAYYTFSHNQDMLLAVIDGASQRLKTTRTQALFATYGTEVTAARYATLLTRDTFAQYNTHSPKDMLLAANTQLRQQLISIYGELSPTALLKAEPHLTELQADPRLIRLALPVCVATVAKVDLAKRQLVFAHAGDTALFVFYENGQVSQLTHDQMGQHDDRALVLAKSIQKELNKPQLVDVLSDPCIIEINRVNGIYHNYVDAQGEIDRNVGVGVINGLPQLAAYIQEGSLSLAGVNGILVCSDGFIWPARWSENDHMRQERLRLMKTHICEHGLSGYLDALRQTETADSSHNTYPRFKQHDDATAVYLELS